MGALTQSVLPMLNAFAIVCLVTAIYAIIGVTFFAKIEPDLFASFFISFFSLFQVATFFKSIHSHPDSHSRGGMGLHAQIFNLKFTSQI